HQAAVRALAFKWIRIVFRCWQTRGAYDESVYLAALQRRGSSLIGEQGDAGDYAAAGISSTSISMSEYQRLKTAPNSPSSVFTRACSNKCAPCLDHCICCFLQNRLLTTSFTVDSTKPVAIASPW